MAKCRIGTNALPGRGVTALYGVAGGVVETIWYRPHRSRRVDARPDAAAAAKTM